MRKAMTATGRGTKARGAARATSSSTKAIAAAASAVVVAAALASASAGPGPFALGFAPPRTSSVARPPRRSCDVVSSRGRSASPARRRALFSTVSDDRALEVEEEAPAFLADPVVDPTIASSVTFPSATISTDELLSCMIHASLLGSRTIKNLCERARSDSDAIAYKIEGDARSALTIADAAAQRVVVSGLSKKFPRLHIVGEEDETVDATDFEGAADLDGSWIEHMEFRPPEPPREEARGPGGHREAPPRPPPDELDLEDLIVFVDPLDGTREFVEGRLDNVQCLVGAVYRGTPILGAMGLPFPLNGEEGEGRLDGEPNGGKVEGRKPVEAVFGMVGRGVGRARLSDDGNDVVSCPFPAVESYHPETGGISVSSGDSSSVRPAVDLARRVFGPNIEHRIVGACGNKILQCAYGKTSIAIQHDQTSLWDTAAPAAVLAALGGKATDYFGEPLNYDPATELGNKLGVVASAPGAGEEHGRLTSAMRGDRRCLSALNKYGLKFDAAAEGEAQCVDIVRDLRGRPRTSDYFRDKLGSTLVDSYSCPEREAFRGLMSDACRVRFHPGKETAFYKRIDFQRLSHAQEKLRRAPHKLASDAESYRVVTAFLSSRACERVGTEAGVRIPKLLDAELEPDDVDPIRSKFAFLLEDLAPSDGWKQGWLLEDRRECEAALTTLAKVHAYFWTGSTFWDDVDDARELEDAVWKSASYVQPRRNAGQWKTVASKWETERLKCEGALGDRDYWDDLGTRLQSVAEACGREANPFAEDEGFARPYKRHRTFCHGDPKQANFLFRATKGDATEPEVGLLDYQWSGFGLAATDVAHCLASAVHADRLTDGGEESLLERYYDELRSHLVEFGAFEDAAAAREGYDRATFAEQYETAILDHCRLVIAYTWKRFEPVDDDDDLEGRARTFNKNSYNKSTSNVVWLMDRCDGILRSRGV
ncbi:hypothetical protein ACHAWF_016692 [Thalassiosira exigua]